MDAKVAAVRRLRAEVEESRHLAALKEEEAEAVRNLMTATISTAHVEFQQALQSERGRASRMGVQRGNLRRGSNARI